MQHNYDHNAIVIPRPGLARLLERALQEPVAVVHAGAGFGKARFAADFLAESGYRTVWMALTLFDNSPACFWENLMATFGLHRPRLAERMHLIGFPESQQLFHTFLTYLTDELYQDRMPVVFVFDDLYRIENTAVRNFLHCLASARLENSCILFITRQWPFFEEKLPVPPRLIGPEDLRFSGEETAALFTAYGIALDPGEAEAIHRYVSGWPIALSLVAMAMAQEGPGVVGSRLLDTTKPRLFALFEQAIFSQYTEAEQALLVKLSVLESFPRGLVQAVSGEQERELGQLMQDNIFIRYDASERRFYFHALYLEYLREKLVAVPGPERDDVYRRAADWCRLNGHYFDAIHYYGQCGCPEGIWESIRGVGAARWTRSEADFFIRQIEGLPEDFRAQNPMTQIVLSVMLVNNLHFDRAVRVLDDVQRAIEQMPADAPGKNALMGECYTARGLITLGMEQNGFEGHFKRAAELLPAGSSRWNRGFYLIDLGPGLNLQSSGAGALEESLACFTEGVPAMVKVLRGTGQGLDKLCTCEAMFLRGDVKGALQPAYDALYTATAASQYDIAGSALFVLLHICTVTGDYKGVQDILGRVREYREDPASAGLGIWDIIEGWFYAEVGDTGKVAAWIRDAVRHGLAPISIGRALLLRMRCLIADNQYHEALALIDTFATLAEGKGAVIARIHIGVARAICSHGFGRVDEALAEIGAAYRLACGNQIVMPFIAYGHRTRSLLERARAAGGHGIPADWLEDIHARAATAAKRHAFLAGRYRQDGGEHTDFGLSRREIELIGNLGQGLTRQEISESMGLSLNTVKSMMKQLFAKLGAINSADAVRIAVVNKII